MINCIIVDDEPLARDMIRLHLASFPNWQVVQQCMNALEAYEALHNHPVQVIFLDIQMPKIKGNEFLMSPKTPSQVLFNNAYAEFGVEGFELNVIDYLMKPITFERFRQTIEKVESVLAMKSAVLNHTPQQPVLASDENNFLF